jgi:hypothetical protein
VADNNLVRDIFGSARAQSNGRKVHKQLHHFYSSANTGIVKSQMRWAGHAACMQAMRNVHRLLIGNLERKSPFTRTVCS